jgi:hypothetical protein
MCCRELEKNKETIVEIYPQWALLLGAPATFPSNIVVCWSWNAPKPETKRTEKKRKSTAKNPQEYAKTRKSKQFVIFPQTVCPQYHPHHQHCHTFSDHYPPTPPTLGSLAGIIALFVLDNIIWRKYFGGNRHRMIFRIGAAFHGGFNKQQVNRWLWNQASSGYNGI